MEPPCPGKYKPGASRNPSKGPGVLPAILAGSCQNGKLGLASCQSGRVTSQEIQVFLHDTPVPYTAATESEREYRFLLARPAAESLIDTVAAHMRLVTYEQDRPFAYARTTYLDTADRAYYHSAEVGPVRRRLRVREYAAAAGPEETPVFTGVTFLELKESTGTTRDKKRRPIEADEIDQFMAESQVQPCLTTWYRRVSFAEDTGRVRVTMDEGILYAMPGGFGRAGEPVPGFEVVEYGPSRVIEVKLVGEPVDWIARPLAGLEEASDYSKFRMGMRAVDGGRRGSGRRTRPLEIPPLPGDGGE
ncbi:MAG TPA: VTC domain-containing protein [Kofleriaceae bacterium]|nr:VTC domain-containing protein [Kofleriaceae bacterium]